MKFWDLTFVFRHFRLCCFANFQPFLLVFCSNSSRQSSQYSELQFAYHITAIKPMIWLFFFSSLNDISYALSDQPCLFPSIYRTVPAYFYFRVANLFLIHLSFHPHADFDFNVSLTYVFSLESLSDFIVSFLFKSSIRCITDAYLSLHSSFFSQL